jgi:hypothetical protein
VPVRFSEINNVSAMVEIEHRGGSLMPELSFGTHFFQDLVETDIFYVALFRHKDAVMFSRDWIEAQRNALATLLPESGRYEGIVRVCDVAGPQLYLMADIASQKVLCFSSGTVKP